MGSRTWIKIYCDKWLEGTLASESLEVQAIWVKLLALAGSGRYGDTGEIKLAAQIGLTDEQIAAILVISEGIWLIIKQRLIDTNRILVSETNTISIVKWPKYQSEYSRQQGYRGRLQGKVTREGYKERLQGKVTSECHKENRIE